MWKKQDLVNLKREEATRNTECTCDKSMVWCEPFAKKVADCSLRKNTDMEKLYSLRMGRLLEPCLSLVKLVALFSGQLQRV